MEKTRALERAKKEIAGQEDAVWILLAEKIWAVLCPLTKGNRDALEMRFTDLSRRINKRLGW